MAETEEQLRQRLLLERLLLEQENARRPQEERPPNVNPGVAPEAPPEMILNPFTGQYTDPALLQGIAGQDMGPLDAFRQGAEQGISFGWGDEALAAIGAAVPGEGAAEERYTFAREVERAQDEAAREAHPWLRGAGEVAGGAAASAILWNMLGMQPATGPGGRAAQGAGMGGVEGSVYGGGVGEGWKDRIAKMLTYGAVGSGVGGILPPILDIAGAGVRTAGRAIRGVSGKPNQAIADAAVSRAARRSGQSIDDIESALRTAAREGQPEYVAADAMRRPGGRLLGASIRNENDMEQEVADFLLNRAAGEHERLSRFASEAFDMDAVARRLVAEGFDPPDRMTAEGVSEALSAAKKRIADDAYAAARQGARPVNLQNAIDTIDDLMKRNPLVGDDGLRETEIGRRLLTVRNQIAAPDGNYQLIDFDTVLNVKQDLGQVIERIRNARESIPPQLAKVYGALDEALEASSDAYRAANDEFARRSGVIKAIEEGAEMAKPGAVAEDTAARFGAMTPEQQEAARLGYGAEVRRNVERPAGETTSRARPLRSPKVESDIATLSADPELMRRRIARELQMNATGRKALFGSETAERTIDDAAMSDRAFGVLGNLARLRFGAAAGAAARGAGDALVGNNEATRAEIARILLSRDPRAALERAMVREGDYAQKMLIANILARALGRQEPTGMIAEEIGQ